MAEITVTPCVRCTAVHANESIPAASEVTKRERQENRERDRADDYDDDILPSGPPTAMVCTVTSPRPWFERFRGANKHN